MKEDKVLRAGFLCSGDIAHRVSTALKKLDQIELYAVASRNREHAQALADEFGFRKVYGSYEELLEDPDVDLAYVGVPHPWHYQLAKMCAEHGKALLLEKPFTINHYQAEEVIRLYEEKGLFLGEALWTRFLPGRKFVDDVIAKGLIGDVRMVDANMICDNWVRARMTSPAMGGGALLDLGVYALNFAVMFLGTNIVDMKSTVSKWKTGVDEQEAAVLAYPDGRLAVCKASMNGAGDVDGVIFGSKGSIRVSDVMDFHKVTVLDPAGKVLAAWDNQKGVLKADGSVDEGWTKETDPDQVTGRGHIVGYEYEFLAARNALLEGKSEFAEMSHADTRFMMERYDALRHSWGIDYPAEYGLQGTAE